MEERWTWALIHSPLVGPSTWSRVAAELERLGLRALVPTLVDSEADGRAYWEQHVQSAVTAIDSFSSGASPLILVGHSGAGPILPAIGNRLERPPAGYVFVDAGLPSHRTSRLEMLKSESRTWADEFEKHLEAGGRFPNWSDADLRPLIPDEKLRDAVLTEMQPRGRDFFTESISVPEDWSTVPSGYIQFSDAYAVPAEHARRAGWPFIRLQAGHFHMLVDPAGVAGALVEISGRLLTAV
ncbi:MAG: alpha/beta fold hydrolase [Candidatus Eiseniibacteriota bacterium]